MKIHQSIFTIGIAAALLTGVTSCKKQLEEKPFSFISPNNFYQNEADAKTAVNGIYSALYSWDLYLQPIWNLTVLDDDHVSGVDWFMGTSGAGNPQGYWGVDGPWKGYYSIISRANTVLENVANIPADRIDADMKKRFMGEAYFLRGWSYFQLVQLYGGVPLRLQSLSANPEANVPRATVKQTYDAVIEDLKQAETLLFPVGDTKAGEAGRVTRGTAKGMLAKVYATMGSAAMAGGNITIRGGQDNGYYSYAKTAVTGMETVDSKAYYQLAMEKALELINSNEYMLFSNYREMWSKAGRNQKEHMFEVQSLSGSAFVNNLHNYFSAYSTFGRGAVWVTNNHYIDYEDADKRVLDGVAHNYSSNNGTRYYYPSWQAALYQNVGGLTYNNNGTTDNRAYVIKFADVADPTVANSDAFFPILRYADILLIYAEAANEYHEGPTTDAYAKLNLLRSTRSASDAPAGMSREQFRSFVLAERGREFALEGIRRFDLLRWNVYLPVMNKISAGQNNISKVRSLRNMLLPIPLSELNSNSAITGNNPGW